jgi:hypothetical protein
LREQQKNSDRHLADLSNEKSAGSRKRKHVTSANADASEDEIKDGKTKDTSMKEIDDAGKHFAIQFQLFINVKDLKQVIITKKYKPEKRFKESPEMERQGLIQDILQLLPTSLAKQCRKQKRVDEWILQRVSEGFLHILTVTHLSKPLS